MKINWEEVKNFAKAHFKIRSQIIIVKVSYIKRIAKK